MAAPAPPRWPITRSMLINALLNGIMAYGAGPSETDYAPEGLLKLVRHKWPDGTVLTRDQLEAARDGHPDIPE